MKTNLTGLALALSVGAVAVAGYALLRDRSGPADLSGRLDAIENRIAGVEKALAEPERRVDEGATLVGRRPVERVPAPERAADAPRAAVLEGKAADGAPLSTGDGPEAEKQIQELVDEAVEKKAAQIQRMVNKKPSIDVFAETLELSDVQRKAVEQEVLRGQREIRSLLETPAADGTIFMDELVEVLAEGMAHPGEKTGRGMKLFGRIMAEEVPGTGETYAERAEALKDSVRAAFRREMTEQQYAAFEAWQMDPTEIQDIEYSPWKDIETRVIERAQQLGAEIPDDSE